MYILIAQFGAVVASMTADYLYNFCVYVMVCFYSYFFFGFYYV